MIETKRKRRRVRDAVCYVVGGLLLVAASATPSLDEPAWGWLLVAIGGPVFLIPFGALIAELRRVRPGGRRG